MNLPECKASKTHKEIVRIMVFSIPCLKDGQATSNTKARAPLPGFSRVIWDEWGKKGVRMDTKALKKQMGAAIAMVLVAAVALGSATFAWFVSNNAVTATGVDVTTTSSVPNLYITSVGHTSDAMTPAPKNPTKIYPISTPDAENFFETLHWTTGNGHAVADKYQTALAHETGKTNYADYTFKLGVSNGKMDVYFDSSTVATNLKASAVMGTAGRFAVKVGDGQWLMFKVPGTATDKGYYTDQNATTGDYWVQSAADGIATATYLNFATYAGSVNDKGQAVAGTTKLATIESGTENEVTVTVRVWYEGCDKDCVSENAGSGIANAISGNLGFVGVQAE